MLDTNTRYPKLLSTLSVTKAPLSEYTAPISISAGFVPLIVIVGGVVSSSVVSGVVDEVVPHIPFVDVIFSLTYKFVTLIFCKFLQKNFRFIFITFLLFQKILLLT